MTMTVDKLDIGNNGGMSVSGPGNNRRHTDSPATPMLMDSFYIDIPTPSARSISPMSTSVSPAKDKSFSFFKTVYRKISLKSSDDLDQLGVHGDDDSRSSSVDSYSSISDHRDQPLSAPTCKGRQDSRCSSASKLQLQLSNLALSSASSESAVSACSRADSTKETIAGNQDAAKENRRKSRRSSVLKLLESLAIHAPMRSRSLSCSNSSVNNLIHTKGRESRAESKCSLFSTNSASNGKETSKPPPKKILRRPVSYTYLRGISGLPTQRVPRSSICCSYYGR